MGDIEVIAVFKMPTAWDLADLLEDAGGKPSDMPACVDDRVVRLAEAALAHPAVYFRALMDDWTLRHLYEELGLK